MTAAPLIEGKAEKWTKVWTMTYSLCVFHSFKLSRPHNYIPIASVFVNTLVSAEG